MPGRCQGGQCGTEAGHLRGELVRPGPSGGQLLPRGRELPLRRLIEADGVVMVAPEREGYPAGEEIEVWRL